MGKKIKYLSSEDNFYIRFVYRTGERNQIKKAHLNAFEQHDEFEIPATFIRTDHGNIEISDDDVPAVTNMSYLDNYECEGDSDSLDLWYAPLITYVAGPSYLYNQENRVTDPVDDEALETLIDIVEIGYHATAEHPIAVYVETPKHRFYQGEAEQPPFTATSIAHDGYNCLSWLTVFTPPMVETYGRETLLSTPAYHTKKLDDGGILLVCHNRPLDWNTDCREVADSLGLPLLQDLA